MEKFDDIIGGIEFEARDEVFFKNPKSLNLLELSLFRNLVFEARKTNDGMDLLMFILDNLIDDEKSLEIAESMTPDEFMFSFTEALKEMS